MRRKPPGYASKMLRRSNVASALVMNQRVNGKCKDQTEVLRSQITDAPGTHNRWYYCRGSTTWKSRLKGEEKSLN